MVNDRTAVNLFQTRDASGQRGLPAAAASQDADGLPSVQVKARLFEHIDSVPVPAEGLAEIPYLQQRRLPRPVFRRTSSFRQRSCFYERLRIALPWTKQDFFRRPFLDDGPVPQDDHAVARFTSYGDVVSDQQNRKGQPLLHLFQQRENLALAVGVERRRRFVRDQDLRFEAENERDIDSLAHPAAEFERIRVQNALGVFELQKRQHLPALTFERLLRTGFVKAQRLKKMSADRLDGVERQLSVLVNHGDPLSAQRPPVETRRSQVQRRLVSHSQGAALDSGRGGQHPQKRFPAGRFARAAFAKQRQQFSLFQEERHALQHLEPFFSPAVRHAQIFYR